jgi:hypothetical protein
MALCIALSCILHDGNMTDLAFCVMTKIDAVNIGNNIDLIIAENFRLCKEKKVVILLIKDILQIDLTATFLEWKDGHCNLQLNTVYYSVNKKCQRI